MAHKRASHGRISTGRFRKSRSDKGQPKVKGRRKPGALR